MNALRHAGFRRMATAWAFSNFGDSTLYLSLAIWVKDLTDSDAAAGMVFFFLGLPAFAAPIAGVLADRFSRRRTIVMANLVGCVGVLSLALVNGVERLWLVYAVTLGYGFLTYVTAAAGSGLLRDLLAEEQLASANGTLSTLDQGMRLISPLVGAGAYALFGGVAIAIVTSASLAIAAAIMLTVRAKESSPDPARPRVWAEASAGFRHIGSVPALRQLTVVLAVAFAATGLANSAVFGVVDRGLGRPSEFFGVLAAAQGAGAILGGITAARVVRRAGEQRSVAVGLVVLGVGALALGVSSVAVVLAAMVVVGISVPWIVVGFSTFRQRSTPARLQGRVSAATTMAINGPATLGTVLGAWLVARIDHRAMLLVMGIALLAAVPPLLRPSRGSAVHTPVVDAT